MPAAPRILVLTRKFPDSQWCGAGMRNAQTVSALQQGADVRVFHVELPGTSRLPEDDIPEYDIHILPRPWSRVAFFLSPASTIADLLFDVRIARALEEVILSFRPDTLVMAEAWLYRYLPYIRPHIRRLIVDFQNIETCLFADIMRDTSLPFTDRLLARSMLRAARISEKACVEAADDIWVCSDADAVRCHERYPHVGG